MKPLILLVLVFVLLNTALSADINQYYTFEYNYGSYQQIAGTIVSGVVGDDHISNVLSIGFPFQYGANTYNQIKISSNGYITLSNSTGNTASNDLASLLYCPVLAPLWDDTWLTGSAQMLISGTEPTRELVVQFTGMKWSYYINNSFSYQVIMYENGRIDFCYGPAIGQPADAHASIGINMLPGGSGNFLSITPESTPTVSSTNSNNMVSIYPGENMVYSFMPSAAPTQDLAGQTITGPITPAANIENIYNVQIMNHGSQEETDYMVQLMDGLAVIDSLAGPPLAPNETTTVSFIWVPEVYGYHTLFGKVVLNGDTLPENDETNHLIVSVLPNSPTTVTVGVGTDVSLLPIVVASRNSLSETLYLASELNTFGDISAIAYYNSFQNNVPDVHTVVWMGMTTEMTIPENWIPASDLTRVFDGLVQYPAGENVICIPFRTLFQYTGDNLVIMVYRTWCNDTFSVYDMFKRRMGIIDRSLLEFSSSVTIDPNNPPINYGPTMVIPTTTFYFDSVGIDSPEIPVNNLILTDYPNPFNSQTTIKYEVNKAQTINLSIYNIKGQLVKTIVNEYKQKGQHDVTWEGKDNNGTDVCPGVYLCKLQYINIAKTLKILKIR
jgi:hypothetical protein